MHPTLGQGLALMTRVFSGLRPGPRGGPRAKARRRLAPEVAPLEGRVLQYFAVDAAVAPNTLWPPDSRFVPVTISGFFHEFALVGTGTKVRQVFEKLPG